MQTVKWGFQHLGDENTYEYNFGGLVLGCIEADVASTCPFWIVLFFFWDLQELCTSAPLQSLQCQKCRKKCNLKFSSSFNEKNRQTLTKVNKCRPDLVYMLADLLPNFIKYVEVARMMIAHILICWCVDIALFLCFILICLKIDISQNITFILVVCILKFDILIFSIFSLNGLQ